MTTARPKRPDPTPDQVKGWLTEAKLSVPDEMIPVIAERLNVVQASMKHGTPQVRQTLLQRAIGSQPA